MKQKIILVPLSILLFLSFQFASAAEVELIAPKESEQGQIFSVEVKLSQPKEPVNAISGKVIFNPEDFKLNSISNGGSVISLWLESPESLKEGEIEFAGVTPGGLISGKLFSFEVTALKEGVFNVNLQDLKFVANDGSGKSFLAEPASVNIAVKAGGQEPAVVRQPAKDTAAPLPFIIQVARDESIFNNQWFAVFNAVDAGSGISYYEAAESPFNNQNNLVWKKTSSPYLLTDQNRKSFVFVKAVDREGNYVISTLKPEKQNSGLGNISIYGIIGILISVIFGALFWLKKQNVKKSQQTQ